MTYDEAIAYFGTQTKLAHALGIKQPAVSLWGKVIPKPYQYQLEVITNRRLRADAAIRKPATQERRARAG